MNRFKVAITLVSLTLSLAGVAAEAQRKGPDDSEAPNLAIYRRDLVQNRERLSRVEATLTKIEQEKRLTEQDSDAIDAEMYAYATAIKNAYDQATQQAELAGRTKGKQGSAGHFLTFEQTAQEDQRKVEQIQKRLEAIHNRVESKEIRLEERSTELDPAGRDLRASAAGFYDSIAACLDGPWDFVDGAEASLALPCVAPCSAQNWVACAACIVSKAPGAVSAWNSFQSCWNGAHKPFQAWKRAGCVAVFLARIA